MVNDMRLIDTPEMKILFEKAKPYLDNRYQLSDNAPDEVKYAFGEYQRLSKEQEEFAYSL